MKICFVMMLMVLLLILVVCKVQDGIVNIVVLIELVILVMVLVSELVVLVVLVILVVVGEIVVVVVVIENVVVLLLFVLVCLIGLELVVGIDYVVIENGQLFQLVIGKIEVVEVFGYVCLVCVVFQLLIGLWKVGLLSDVSFVYVLVMFGNIWDDYGCVFYVVQSMGLQDKIYEVLYVVIYVQQILKGECGCDLVEDIVKFYFIFGVDLKQFVVIMSSFVVNVKINVVKQFVQCSGVIGILLVIVNGKYLVKGKSFLDMLCIVDYLVVCECVVKGN